MTVMTKQYRTTAVWHYKTIASQLYFNVALFQSSEVHMTTRQTIDDAEQF